MAIAAALACCLSVIPVASAASMTTAAASSYLARRARSESASARALAASPMAPRRVSLVASPPVRSKGALDAISDVSAIVSASARHSEASAAAVLGTTWMTRGHPTTAWPPTVHHTTYAPAL